jgi:hypothetical protein
MLIPTTVLTSSGGYSACKLYRSSNQTLNDATWTPITWDAEVWDTDSYHSTSSNTERILIPANGRYRVTAILNWAANINNQRMCSLNKNGYPGAGGTELVRSTVQAAGNFEPTNMLVAEFDLTTSDYLVVAGYQNRGGTLDLLGSGSTGEGVISSIIVQRVYT